MSIEQRPAPMEPVFIPQGAKHQLIGEARDYRVLEIAFLSWRKANG